MGSGHSVQYYSPLPNDDLELTKINDNDDNTEEVSFAEKADTNLSLSYCDKYIAWVRKRKEHKEEKQRTVLENINRELAINKMMLELVEIAKTALRENPYEPISDVIIKEVLNKYDNVGYSKQLYNIIDVMPKTTPRQG